MRLVRLPEERVPETLLFSFCKWQNGLVLRDIRSLGSPKRGGNFSCECFTGTFSIKPQVQLNANAERMFRKDIKTNVFYEGNLCFVKFVEPRGRADVGYLQ